jgi:2-succinyl-5-enolpyruvyl-6-hydroxy-3-cyclohexene-1-carboxylate synthase
LTSTVVVDERSAGFFALGQARATGEPALVVCTSGTAGAHYLPAIVEASQSRVPMIVLTADRPFELRGRGAAQTIDQPAMFGRFVRASIELPSADPDMRAIDGLLRTTWLAYHRSTWPEAGPVHLNLGFRKPLEPTGQADPELADLRAQVASQLATGFPGPARSTVLVDGTGIDEAVERIRSARRGVLLLGPSGLQEAPSADAVRAFCEASGFPVIAEATSQHRFGDSSLPTTCDVFEPLFDSTSFRATMAPDLVVHVGVAPVGRALGSWVAEAGVERILVASHGLGEAYNQAAQIMVGDPDSTLRALAEGLPASTSVDAGWVRSVTAASEIAGEAVDRHLSSVQDGRLSQGSAVRLALQAVPRNGLLMLGNSMPVRDVDIYCRSADRGIGVLSQRGASGIDGLVSGAIGSAVASRRPTVLLLGDVSFQHDIGGLSLSAAAVEAEVPIAIVVVQNGGGRLFELLPARELMESEGAFERFYLTPDGLKIEAAAAAFGVPVHRASDGASLAESLAMAMGQPGATVIEAVVDGAAAASAISSIHAAVEEKLAP